MAPEDYEKFEEEVVDQATAAQTIAELEAEVFTLEHLEKKAKALRDGGQDRKWEELREILQNTPEMRGPDGLQRKLIIFTEHRDTLNYLADRIRGLLGKHEAVNMIHGGVHREDRGKVQELFRNDKDTRVLLATDAAGEGVNLQNANLMVNYDLPWHPNRLEQRFGRIVNITSACLDYEGEIAIVIGRGGCHIIEADAWSHIAGYSCYNDGSVRDWQVHTSQWGPGKNFWKTGAFGPWMVSADEFAPDQEMTLVTRLNGQELQRATTGMMVHSIPR